MISPQIAYKWTNCYLKKEKPGSFKSRRRHCNDRDFFIFGILYELTKIMPFYTNIGQIPIFASTN
jgi:hypothetical protein